MCSRKMRKKSGGKIEVATTLERIDTGSWPVGSWEVRKKTAGREGRAFSEVQETLPEDGEQGHGSDQKGG